MESGSMQVNPKPASYHAANNSPVICPSQQRSKPTFLNRLDMFFFNFFTRSRSIPAPKQPGILVGPSSEVSRMSLRLPPLIHWGLQPREKGDLSPK
ncbi:hypothetical protein PGTUg99_000297 [Puccinia graminis f. sp. tritici]|uniref:Uncharacterized protein n=1 Tax=Puccinia graminis f. sp. tritici TaxID=56615 RepID=A0A5B0MMC6_PUCGR|nr:hypothetical protein PGTUg99_000297 [Puccinia graminis f. sp. tritici]